MFSRLTTLLPIVVLAAAAPAAAAQDWSPPAPISGAALHAPAQATGEGGTVAVAGLVSDAEGARKVRVAVRAPGGEAHSFAVGLRSGVPTFPDVAVDRQGIATAVWTQGSSIATARCSVRGCGRTQTIGRTTLPIGDPQVAIDPTDRATVLWRGITKSGARRLQWRIGPRGHFGPTHTLGEFGFGLQLATDDDGRTTAAWTAQETGFPLRVADRVRGEFERPRTLSPAGQPATRAALAVAPGGQAVLAWRAAPEDGEGEPHAGPVLAAARAADGDFGAPSTISPPGTTASTVATDVSPDGRAVLAWLDYGPDFDPDVGGRVQTVHAVRSEPGGAFGAPEQLGQQGTPTVLRREPLSAVMEPVGTAAVVWGNREGAHAAVGRLGEPFGAAEQLAPGSGQVLEPRASTAPAGVLATWTAGTARVASTHGP